LTIWKSQPRTFAWDYLPYEIEQPISRYYEYNIVKGEKSGRAAWNKKAFNGVDLRSIDLPLGFETQLVWAAFERYDNFEREFIDFSNDLGLADSSYDAKQQGIEGEGGFDLALAFGVLHHLDDAEAAQVFACARRALKP